MTRPSKRLLRICGAIAAASAALLTVRWASAEPFTLVVLPDTQTETMEKPQKKFPAITQWIVDHRQDRNIPFVAHVGDLVNWETPQSDPPQFQYVNADAAMSLLDVAGIPYAIALGNHDTAAVGGKNPDGTACHCGGSAGPGDVHANVRNTTVFNQFFPPTRFANIQATYEPQKSDNTFHTFRAGGVDWLVLTAELDPRPSALDWANQVIADHPQHNVIYLTHNYLDPSGDLAGPVGYGDLSPQKVWDGLLKLHRNVRFVLSGHLTETATLQTKGNSGETVYQILTDYQNLGEGWLRTLEIDTDAKTVKSEVYSPYLDQHKTGESEVFTLNDVMFIPPAVPDPVAGGAGGASGAASSAGSGGSSSGAPTASAGSDAGGAPLVSTPSAGQSAMPFVPVAGSNAVAPTAAPVGSEGCACRLAPTSATPTLLALAAALLPLLRRRRSSSSHAA